MANYREKDIVFEAGNFWVLRDVKKSRYTVFSAGITASTSDSSYPLNSDGLSLAEARATYLAKRAKQI